MAKVEIYKLQDDGTQRVLAVCKLEGEHVIFEGDENLINFIKENGITDYSKNPPEPILPEQGILFLRQLKNNFSSGYINASDVVEE